jgi:hypothetical protein
MTEPDWYEVHTEDMIFTSKFGEHIDAERTVPLLSPDSFKDLIDETVQELEEELDEEEPENKASRLSEIGHFETKLKHNLRQVSGVSKQKDAGREN